MCEDYRAGASIDLKHDEADMTEEDRLPAARAVGREGRDGRALRRAGHLARARRPRSSASRCPAGHNLQEDVPDMVLAEIQGLLKMA